MNLCFEFMGRTRLLLGVFLLLAIAMLAGCAADPSVMKDSVDLAGSVAGFWRGLWHGMILPVSFVVSIFSDSLSIYEIHNNGTWYNFGFLLGAATVFEGGSSSARGSASRSEWS